MIGERDVVVFLARPEALADPDVRAAALALLAPEDRAHVERFRFERDREQALASRALQRRALSACSGVDPAAWRFVADDAGRPVIAGPPDAPRLSFNVANAHGLVGCAVTRDRAIGLDLEPHRADAPLEVVERYFAVDERAELAALPSSLQPRRFIDLWALKEAYIKARGIGLGLPLEQILIRFVDGMPRLALDPALGDDAERWQLALWSLTPDHAVALCVRREAGAPLTIDRRWLAPAPAAQAPQAR